MNEAAPDRRSPALLCEGLEKSFGSSRVVDGVSLTLPEGEILALLGPSGCGKTTTLRMVAGLESADAGSVTVGGRAVAGPGLHVAPDRRAVGLVFQQYALFPHLTVLENIAFGVGGSDEDNARVQQLVATLGLSHRKDARTDALSGGEQQRVALARALAPRPRLVLLDEPFANLDASLRESVRDEMRDVLHAVAASALLVTHDQQEAMGMADRVAVMDGGRVLQCASPDALYRSPDTLRVAQLLGDGTALPADVRSGEVMSALGTGGAPNTIDGKAVLFVRPEELQLCGRGARGTVRARRFTGPAVLLVISLGESRVTVRVAPDTAVQVGDDVQVELIGPCRIFPGAAGAET